MAGRALGDAISNAVDNWDLDKGGAEYGRRQGVGADRGRRAAHEVKKRNPCSRPKDKYTINPDTGDVFDENGDYSGNAGDYTNSK